MNVNHEKLQKALLVHGELSQLIAPVTPASIRASSFLRNKAFLFIVLVAVISFIVLIGALVGQGLSKAFAELLGILGAAGLGASFYALHTAGTYFRKGTFDPQYNQIYLIRLILGISAGLILGLFGDQFFASVPHGGTAEDLKTVAQQSSAAITKAALALVGGYSSEAVAQILKRFSDTLVTLVRGRDEEQAKVYADSQFMKKKADLGSNLQDALSLQGDAKDKAIKDIIKGLAK